MPSQVPYRGSSPKLVLAFDIGMTYGAVSYCILVPGEVPCIQGVSRYPSQAHVRGNSRIPSILYYDRQGSVRAVGAEALKEHIIDRAEEEDWIKIEWWKLHLRPTSSPIKDGDIPPLPQGISAVQIFADYMRYLFACVRTYIIETHSKGPSLWASLENNIDLVLTYPNEWEGPQQEQIRRAAAGMISINHGSQIHLLTEGEAMVRRSIDALVPNTISGYMVPGTENLQEDTSRGSGHHGAIVISAGEGTIDLYVYSVKLSSPEEFLEVAPMECRLQGFALVTKRAHAFLKAKLANSRYGSPEVIQQMTTGFDKTTKLRFCDASEFQYIRFGSVRDRDPQYDIRSGQLKLAGQDVAKFFEPSVEATVDAFEKQRQKAAKMDIQIKYAFLLGTFAASEFFYRSLRLHPTFSQVNLYRPSCQAHDIVAEGAVLERIDFLTSQTPGSSRDPG